MFSLVPKVDSTQELESHIDRLDSLGAISNFVDIVVFVVIIDNVVLVSKILLTYQTLFIPRS